MRMLFIIKYQYCLISRKSAILVNNSFFASVLVYYLKCK